MDTCIRVKELGSHIYESYLHASYIQDQISRIIDTNTLLKCIMQTCIRIKDQGSLIYASYIHTPGSKIIDICIRGTCITQRQCILRISNMGTHSHIIDAYIMDTFIMNTSIIETCTGIKATWPQASWLHASWINAS